MPEWTKEQVEIVARLIGYADDGCSHCAYGLAEIASNVIPGWRFELTGETEEPDWENLVCDPQREPWPDHASRVVVRVVEAED